MDIKSLSGKNPPEVQAEAIKYFSDPAHIDPKALAQPGGKEYWYNAARCLIAIGYPANRNALLGMFAWLQDLTWPGATPTFDYLGTLPRTDIAEPLTDALRAAEREKDEEWLINLKYFAEKNGIEIADAH